MTRYRTRPTVEADYAGDGTYATDLTVAVSDLTVSHGSDLARNADRATPLTARGHMTVPYSALPASDTTVPLQVRHAGQTVWRGVAARTRVGPPPQRMSYWLLRSAVTPQRIDGYTVTQRTTPSGVLTEIAEVWGATFSTDQLLTPVIEMFSYSGPLGGILSQMAALGGGIPMETRTGSVVVVRDSTPAPHDAPVLSTPDTLVGAPILHIGEERVRNGLIAERWDGTALRPDPSMAAAVAASQATYGLRQMTIPAWIATSHGLTQEAYWQRIGELLQPKRTATVRVSLWQPTEARSAEVAAIDAGQRLRLALQDRRRGVSLTGGWLVTGRQVNLRPTPTVTLTHLETGIGSPAARLLLESGDALLLESGDALLLEAA